MDQKYASRTVFIFLLVPFFLMLFITPLTVAKGGGGGGDGGGSGGGGNSGGSGTGPYLTTPSCDDKGMVTFRQNPPITPVTITNLDDGTLLHNLSGIWEGTTFTSDEAILTSAGSYLIGDERNGNVTFTCPGLVFSCKVVALSIENCQKLDTGIKATFTLANASLDDLTYSFTINSSREILSYGSASYSPELKYLHVEQESNDKEKYHLSLNDSLPVTVLQISHQNCIGRYYVYATSACSEATTGNQADGTGLEKEGKEVSQTNQGNALKCGGYLSITDRVKCRLNLREEEEDEYENFFPEYCRSVDEDEGDCVATYRAIGKCWSFPNGPPRVSCVKQQLHLGDIATEKAACDRFSGDEQRSCMDDVTEKVYDLVEFRLYNLEEEAERLLDENKLSEDAVISFVVDIEASKVAFHEAKTFEEKKAVIKDTQQSWRELIKSVSVKSMNGDTS
ncbi:hypothetical protein HYW21_02240 [Candidatus Woesearchaeota archaeon]|nr:hypothetical protein [Candidatus Woesearchaeota archaeon]